MTQSIYVSCDLSPRKFLGLHHPNCIRGTVAPGPVGAGCWMLSLDTFDPDDNRADVTGQLHWLGSV